MKHSKHIIIIAVIIIISISVFACDKVTEPSHTSLPVLTTAEVSTITTSSAIAGGNITSDGGADVTARGVCWSTTSTPTIMNSISTDSTGAGSFTSTIAGLSADYTYNVRAYAVNSAGTGYGDVVTFSTLAAINPLEYLGQNPPGRILQRFATGIVPDWFHSEVTVSPDGQEIYWTNGTSIYFTKLQNESWSTPQIVPFSGQGTEYYYDDVPVVSPDNKKLFFLSKRPLGYASPSRENIWYVDRTPTGWSEPQPLPQIVNSIPEIHWQVSVANNGTLYYCAGDRIQYSCYINGKYTTPESLNAINAFGRITCPFIAPDESYIIFCKIVQSVGNLYVSFKSNDGQWMQPQILNIKSEATSFVSRDGKYFFTGRYWISAEIIEDLRSTN